MNTPMLDDVLNAFAMEPDYGKPTLEKYLQRYPQFAIDLVDLSRQLQKPVKVDRTPLSQPETDRVNAAWIAHAAYRPAGANAADPLAVLNVGKSRELARVFDLPRQVFTALHERRVKVASIPQRFLRQIAASLNMTAEMMSAALSQAVVQPARSHKSDEKPVVSEQVSLEQLLIDAQVPAERRAELLAEDN